VPAHLIILAQRPNEIRVNQPDPDNAQLAWFKHARRGSYVYRPSPPLVIVHVEVIPRTAGERLPTRVCDEIGGHLDCANDPLATFFKL
jgi:hypothetical protein